VIKDCAILAAIVAGLQSPELQTVFASIFAAKKVLKKTRQFKNRAAKMGLQSGIVKANELLTEFEFVGGIDALEALQYHPNQAVYRKAYDLLKGNFEPDYCNQEPYRSFL
jgi:hypothetical protein